MVDKLLTEHHLEFLSIKAGCTGSPESIHDKMPHCWKSRVMAQMMPIIAVVTGPVSLLYMERILCPLIPCKQKSEVCCNDIRP